MGSKISKTNKNNSTKSVNNTNRPAMYGNRDPTPALNKIDNNKVINVYIKKKLPEPQQNQSRDELVEPIKATSNR